MKNNKIFEDGTVLLRTFITSKLRAAALVYSSPG